MSKSDLHTYITELLTEGLTFNKVVDRLVFEYGFSETVAENMVYDVESEYIETILGDRDYE